MRDHRPYPAEACNERCVVDNEIWPCETVRLRRTTTGYPEAPECDKMLAVKDKAEVLQEFVDWLNDERGYAICESRPSGMSTASEELDEWWPASYGGYNKLFADFFGIDLDKVEGEKQAILNHLREMS